MRSGRRHNERLPTRTCSSGLRRSGWRGRVKSGCRCLAGRESARPERRSTVCHGWRGARRLLGRQETRHSGSFAQASLVNAGAGRLPVARLVLGPRVCCTARATRHESPSVWRDRHRRRRYLGGRRLTSTTPNAQPHGRRSDRGIRPVPRRCDVSERRFRLASRTLYTQHAVSLGRCE
jgi:hypothetical protein